MAPLKRLVIDVLKPHDPPLHIFAERLADLREVDGVTASLLETDEKVSNVKVTLKGGDVEYGVVEECIEDMGCSLHSIDEVACGEEIVEEVRTPQDRHRC